MTSLKLYLDVVKFDGKYYAYLLEESIEFLVDKINSSYGISEVHLVGNPIFHPDIYNLLSIFFERDITVYLHFDGLLETDFPTMADSIQDIRKYIRMVIEFNPSLLTSNYSVHPRIYKNLLLLSKSGYNIFFRVPLEFFQAVSKDLMYAVSEIGITIVLSFDYQLFMFDAFGNIVSQIYYNKQIPLTYDHYIIPILANDITTINHYIDRGYFDDWFFEKIYITFDRDNIVVYPTIKTDIDPKYIAFIKLDNNFINNFNNYYEKMKEMLLSFKGIDGYPGIFFGDVYMTLKKNDNKQHLLFNYLSLLKIENGNRG